MVTQQDIDQIKATPRRQQGPLIDAAIDKLMLNGRNKTEAINELAEALDMKAGTISVGYYRRRRDPEKPVKPRTPRSTAPSANGDEPVDVKASHERTRKSLDRYAAFEKLINEMVEERVAARLAEARKALA